MPEAEKHVWGSLELVQIDPLLSRKLVHADRLMLAQVFLKTGCIVPAHDHHNQQVTYILEGCLRFWIGEHADAPGDEYVDIHAGEVLMIPSNVRHRAEALEDTLDVDIFSPPRQDWLDKTDAYLRK
jgi:quercetin dioxygenase-like cupin family protein